MAGKVHYKTYQWEENAEFVAVYFFFMILNYRGTVFPNNTIEITHFSFR